MLRFKSVCKSWLSLIESSFFINLHTSTTFNSSFSSSSKFGSFIFHAAIDKDVVDKSEYSGYKTVRENTLIMLSSSSKSESESESRSIGSGSGSGSGSSSVCWWSTDPDVLCDVRFPWLKKSDGEDDESDDDQVFKVDNNNNNDEEQQQEELVFKLDNLGIPSCYKSSVWIKSSLYPKVIGSCNGLICLFDGQHMFDKPQRHVDFSLWNPATRQFRILPKSITIEDDEDGYRGSYLIAFGFDVENKDYKVVLVQLRRGYGMDCPCRVQIYSLSTDSWRILEGITCLPGYPFSDTYQGHYLNGSCFFIARFLHFDQQQQTNDRFIISFDLTKEIFTTIHIPDHDTNHKLYLSYMGDKMALFTVSSPYLLTLDLLDDDDYSVYDSYDHFEIWVLNEHSSSSSVNKESSWTKLHSFQVKCRVPDQLNIPKGISNDGEFALIETKCIGLGKKMKLYNLVTKQVKKNFLCCHGVMSRAADVYKPSLVSIVGGNGSSSS